MALMLQNQARKINIRLASYLLIILNYQLRPLLSKWHPLLQEYEAKKDNDISIKEHEDKWERISELREELDKTRKILMDYSKHLAKVASVVPLYKENEENNS